MNDENFPETLGELIDGVVDEAPSSGKQPVVNRGRITKENAKQYAISAAKAKKLRRETRHRLLAALAASDVDLAEELKKAVRDADESRMSVVERALKCVGLHFDQSDEGRIQNLKIDTKADVNAKVSSPNLNIQFVDAPKPEE